MVLSLHPSAEGVLPGHLLERAIRAGYVDAGRFNIPETNVQPASLDLRLGERALRIRCSFLPGDDTVERKLKDYILDEIDLRGDGAMLEARCPYLIELKERLDLPAGLRGKANPKSSTGRIDVFTRVITDHSDRFDEVAPGYQGPLYLEVVPLSFAVRVREDLTLEPVAPLHRPPLAQRRRGAGRPSRGADPVPGRGARSGRAPRPLRRALPRPGPPRRRAGAGRATAPGTVRPLLDLTSDHEVDPAPFWDPVYREEGDRLVLSPKRFYLLMSHEAVSIPPDLAAEMTAYDPTSGELRTHYAGFFDPGFRLRPQPPLPRLPGRAGGPGPRRAVHGRERAGGVQADLRAHARGAHGPLRLRHRLVLPAARRDPQPVLPAHTGVAAPATGAAPPPRMVSRRWAAIGADTSQ